MNDRQLLKLVHEVTGDRGEVSTHIAVYFAVKGFDGEGETWYIEHIYKSYDKKTGIFIDNDNEEYMIKYEEEVDYFLDEHILDNLDNFEASFLMNYTKDVNIDEIKKLQKSRWGVKQIHKLIIQNGKLQEFFDRIKEMEDEYMEELLEDIFGMKYDGETNFLGEKYYLFYR